MKILKEIYKSVKYRDYNTCYFISFPKSGRTWVRQFLNHYYFINFPFAVTDRSLGSYRKQIPNIKYSHLGYDIADYSFMDNKVDIFLKKRSNNKIIFLVRDPRDILVSYYFQLTKRFDLARDKSDLDWENLKIKDLVYSKTYGISQIVSFMNIWYENLIKNNIYFYLIQYEKIKNNDFKEFSLLLEYLDSSSLNKQSVEESIKQCSFSKMKNNEKKKLHSLNQLKSNSSDNNSFKVRKGLIGDYVNYFDEPEIKYLNKELSKINDDLKSLFL